MKKLGTAQLVSATGQAPDPLDTDHHYPLGPALGQCCGGAVTLRTGVRAVGLGAAHRLYQGGHCLTKWRTLGITSLILTVAKATF